MTFDPPFQRIGVVGLGLIGGSIALRSRAAWPTSTVIGHDRTEGAKAQRRAAVDDVVPNLETLASSADCIVIAAPLNATFEIIDALAARGTRAVVTDVGSTKRQVMAAAGGLVSFVGGHPMAGRERSGIEYAQADLFEGRPWLLVKGSAAQEDCHRVEAFVNGLGASPRWMDAESHDRAVAFVSHVPQMVSVAIMNAARDAIGDEAIAAVAGRAFAEMTRVSVSPADMWQSVFEQNADFVADALQRFCDELPHAADLVNADWIRQAFERAAGAAPRTGKRTSH